ncbi:MAG: EAL domain-containing protein [Acidimicrobiaceae bacterium]|nr:EAL domain-containing protein [Acidimicrobiaceae bacterium]
MAEHSRGRSFEDREGIFALSRATIGRLRETVSTLAQQAKNELHLTGIVVYVLDDDLGYYRPLGLFGSNGEDVDGEDDQLYSILRYSELSPLIDGSSATLVSADEVPESLDLAKKTLPSSDEYLIFALRTDEVDLGIGFAGVDPAFFAPGTDGTGALVWFISRFARNVSALLELSNSKRSESILELSDAVGLSLISDIESKEVMERVVRGAQRVFRASEVLYFSRSNGPLTLDPVSSDSSFRIEMCAETSKKFCGYVAEAKKSVLVGDLNNLDLFEIDGTRVDLEFDPLTDVQIRSAMASPIIGERGEVRGVLCVVHPKAGMFRRSDLRVFEGICNKLSGILQRESLLSSYRRQVSELELVRRMSIATSGAESFDVLAHEVGTVLREELGAVTGYLVVRPRDDQSEPLVLRLVGARGAIGREVFVDGEAVDGYELPIPIVFGDEVVGQLFIGKLGESDATSDWNRILQTISHQIGAAVANIEALSSSAQAAELANMAAQIAHREAEKIQAITDTVRDVTIVFSGDGNIEYVTLSMRDMTGFSGEDVKNLGLRIIESKSRVRLFGEIRVMMEKYEADGLVEPSNQAIEVEIFNKGGGLVLLEVKVALLHSTDGKVEGFVASARDISERKQLEESLRHSAHHDPLTGLPNRRFLEQRLSDALVKRIKRSTEVSLLFIDLDGFKRINDTLGHEAGDQVLLEIAERILACIRPSDMVGRLGGDEFVVLIEGVSDGWIPSTIARRITESLEQPMKVAEHKLKISASIGVAVSSSQTNDASDLLRRADAAMYGAKRSGSHVVVGDETMALPTDNSLLLAPELHRALDNGELEVFYQPIFSVLSAKVVGFEALLRWKHQKLGWTPPSDFIPAGDSSGLSLGLARLVLARAIAMIKRLNKDGANPWVSVNYSPRQFAPNCLEDLYFSLADEEPIVPSSLIVEITETSVLTWNSEVQSWVERLSSLGVRFALDDFGTGASSLSNLRDLPVQLVKIDQVFVQGAPTQVIDGAILAAILMMAKAKGAEIVGEGVETLEQLSTLSEIGIDMVQGFLLKEPVSQEEITKAMANGLGFQFGPEIYEIIGSDCSDLRQASGDN